MSNKKRTAFLSVLLLAASITLLSFSLTYGRFFEESSSSDSGYGSDIEYIVSEQIEVSNVDEFIGAIENGYTNIILSDDATDPFVITAGVTDVGADLILDLNGHELQRNSRDPLLNIVNGVRMTIIDTSASQTGSFYNPVGSVLQINGGTLTVSSGKFESGPRKDEYAVKTGNVFSSTKGGSVATSDVINAEVFKKPAAGSSYLSLGTISMPLITPNVSEIAISDKNFFFVNGNMYFDDFNFWDNSYITADSYVYFTVADTSIQNTLSVEKGSADFYYSYNVQKTTDASGKPSYSYTTQTEGDNIFEAVVYIYNNVKASATAETSYATVRMASGNMYTRGGTFNSYFGVDTAYGIYAEGGYMAVENGAFSVIENGTCIKNAYTNPSSSEYLRVSSGSFSAEEGDAIQISGGKMIITGGTFEKNSVDGGEQSAVIRVSNGILDGSDASNLSFSVSGSTLYGIYAESSADTDSADTDAEVILSGATFTFENGDNNVGVYAESGQVVVSDSIFDMQGDNSVGIEIGGESGSTDTREITVLGTVFQMKGRQNIGVLSSGGSVLLGGTEKMPYSLFFVDYVEDCYGVLAGERPSGASSLSGSSSINVEIMAAQFFMGQFSMGQSNPSDGRANTFNGAGVYLNAEDASIKIGEAYFITAGQGSSGVYAKQGNITQTKDGRLVIITGAVYDEYGAGGTDPSGNWITFPTEDDFTAGRPLPVIKQSISDSHGIYAESGNVSLPKTYVAVYSDAACGIYTAGGSVSVDGRLDMDISISSDGDHSVLSSTAISTVGGNISLSEAQINTDSLGITSQGGNVIVSGKLKLNSSRGTAIYVNGGNLDLQGDAEITSTIVGNTSWGGTDISVPYSYDGVFVDGGSLTSKGMFKITHTGVENDDQSGLGASSLYRQFTVKSFAVRVQAGSSADSIVDILSADISNAVGGGIYVSGSDTRTANVSLGNETSADIDIATTGNTLYDEYFSVKDGNANNWNYKQSKKGGHAVEVNGGTLNIYGGRYSAAQGEGILVKNGTANIYGGEFFGNDNYDEKGNGTGPIAGPAASYSFKVFGGTANVYGGTFGKADSSGSGAFVMGNSQTDLANANIYGGTFVVGGQAGFSVFDYANISFAPRGGEGGLGSDISVSGYNVGMAIENSEADVSINIAGGEFYSQNTDGSCDGIWYSNSNASLVVSGGIFTGSARSGIYFEKAPNSGKVSISGGQFNGVSGGGALGTSSWIFVGNIVASGHTLYSETTAISSSQLVRWMTSYTKLTVS